ncbi:uncharacterized protein LOC101853809 [Aplysia californica]|uniref:Uncharacterized protein LOC101853809 n=1 Tax=Aplysia californica TaxID=6500 RepID=A0ABM1VZ27_APLCA|nr:uncharacterized protein LOC101853809 [Aplysia californica]
MEEENLIVERVDNVDAEIDMTEKEKERSSYLKMLGNIANDLDSLMCDLYHVEKGEEPEEEPEGEEPLKPVGVAGAEQGRGLRSITVSSGDTLGKDSFFSSTVTTSHHQPGQPTSSSHSLASLTDAERQECDSVDSGHDGRTQTGPSPLVFEPGHFGTPRRGHSAQMVPTSGIQMSSSSRMEETRLISTVERLVKTNSIWLLAGLSRAGAVHLLKDRETGNFIVRKSSQASSLALSVQSRLSGHPAVDHYLIEGSDAGFRLQGSAHFFHSVPALIAYYVDNMDEIPYHLRLPSAILQARSTRELASLDMLGQDFWVSPISRKSPSPQPSFGLLHKSCSEPINIQHPIPRSTSQDSTSSRSDSDFSHFMRARNNIEGALRGQPKKFLTRPGEDSQGSVEVSLPSQPCLPPQLNSASGTTPGISVSRNKNSSSLQQISSSNHRQSLRVERSVSHESWLLASSPTCLPPQPELPLKAGQSKQAELSSADIYSSNPSNIPVGTSSGPPLGGSLGPLPAGAWQAQGKSRAWTHPKVEAPKVKSNLYFTTNLGLMQAAESNYFSSSLSDRLSDYEDIWRNSIAEVDPRTAMELRGNCERDSQTFDSHSKPSQSQNGSGKTRRNSAGVSTVPQSACDASAVTSNPSGLSALEQARQIAGSVSDDEWPPLPVAHVKGIQRMENVFSDEPVPLTENPSFCSTSQEGRFVSEKYIGSIQIPNGASQEIKFVTSHSVNIGRPPVVSQPTSPPPQPTSSSVVRNSTTPVQECRQLSKCVFTTTMSVIMSEGGSSEQSSTPTHIEQSANIDSSFVIQEEDTRRKQTATPLSVLGRLSRLKSSSESSIATLSSPLYAEPADAVRLRDKHGKAVNIQVRRRSAPIAPTDPATSKQKVSQNPQLETIFSPDQQDQTQNKFTFDNVQAPVALSRSISLRTGPTHDKPQLQRKHSWRDRLNRLKLGTKALTQRLSPTSDLSHRKHWKPPMAITLGLDPASLNEDVAGALTEPNTPSHTSLFPAKFPVGQGDPRVSVFSESSTVQDMISCVHPELSVRPIPVRHLTPQRAGPPSEYDNLHIYRQSTHSSQGTVYSPPWESGKANQLMQTTPSPTLPPAMDLQERVQRWQEANSSYQEGAGKGNIMSGMDVPASPRSEVKRSNRLDSGSSIDGHHQQQHQQQGRERAASKSSELTSKRSQHESDHVGTNLTSNINHSSSSSCNNNNNNTAIPNNNNNNNNCNTDTSGKNKPALERLSSKCPDVVHCHSVANDSSSQAVQSSSELAGYRIPAMEPDETEHVDQQQTGDPDTRGNTLNPDSRRNSSSMKSPGAKIKDYIVKLSSDTHTTFGSTIENFIQCTLESQETNPQHVMRNVRQFMNGIKNYLVKHGEGELEDLIERERSKLKVNEILNIDAILEQSLHVCVLRPVKHHLYRLFVDTYSRNGALQQLSDNIKYARSRSSQEIGVKPGLQLPSGQDMERIKRQLELMQRAYSPLQKLEHLLKATSTIYHCVQGKVHQLPSRGPSSLGADDFLPVLIYVIVHCGLVAAEVEADFMWGLLQPSLLTGEGGYYLTTLSSAVLVLKNFAATHQQTNTMHIEGHLPTISDMQGFLKIAIPDEVHGSITWKTLPVRPNMNTRDVRALIAHKFKVTNPQDYGLFLLCDGVESQLNEADCPQIVKGDHKLQHKDCYFAFKRLDANIAWPRHVQQKDT